jgi:hypothetical protein
MHTISQNLVRYGYYAEIYVEEDGGGGQNPSNPWILGTLIAIFGLYWYRFIFQLRYLGINTRCNCFCPKKGLPSECPAHSLEMATVFKEQAQIRTSFGD